MSQNLYATKLVMIASLIVFSIWLPIAYFVSPYYMTSSLTIISDIYYPIILSFYVVATLMGWYAVITENMIVSLLYAVLRWSLTMYGFASRYDYFIYYLFDVTTGLVAFYFTTLVKNSKTREI